MQPKLKRILNKIRARVLFAAARVRGQETIPVKLQSGQVLAVRSTDIVGWEILNNESFENTVRHRILSEVQPGMVVLDVGANIGYYTVQMAAKVGAAGRVVAFEPNPVMVLELKRNLELNRLDNVSIQPIALSNRPGEAEFFCPPDGWEAHGSLQPNRTFQVDHTIKVPTRTLDEVIEQLGLAKVDFIKMDVEGAERNVFQGAKRTLSSSNRPAIFFECAESVCRPFGHYVLDVLQDDAAFGYVIEQIDYGSWLARPAGKG